MRLVIKYCILLTSCLCFCGDTILVKADAVSFDDGAKLKNILGTTSRSIYVDNKIKYELSFDFPQRLVPALMSFIDFNKKIQIVRLNGFSAYDYQPYSRAVYTDKNTFLNSDSKLRTNTSHDEEDIDEILNKITGKKLSSLQKMAYLSFDFMIGTNLEYGFVANDKSISYEDFLLAVFRALADLKIGTPKPLYEQFVDNVLVPLSQDLSREGERRPSLQVDNYFIKNLRQFVMQPFTKPSGSFSRYLIPNFVFPEPIPKEILWSGIYRKIAILVALGEEEGPYHLYVYYKNLPLKGGEDNILWGDALEKKRWFKYYFEILRRNGSIDAITKIKQLIGVEISY